MEVWGEAELGKDEVEVSTGRNTALALCSTGKGLGLFQVSRPESLGRTAPGRNSPRRVLLHCLPDGMSARGF
jgi:hypothetical protein